MNKKLMVGALAVALIGGGIAGAMLLPSTNAASSVQKSQVQHDNEQETNDDGVQGDQGAQDNDKEVNDDAPQAMTFSKQQIIDIAVKQTPGDVTSAKLETENGKTAYTITIKDAAGKEQEITVDAATGTIITEND